MKQYFLNSHLKDLIKDIDLLVLKIVEVEGVPVTRKLDRDFSVMIS